LRHFIEAISLFPWNLNRIHLIAISICKILDVEGNIVHIDKIDALNGTPVIDIKPYIPRIDAISDARIPKWVERRIDSD